MFSFYEEGIHQLEPNQSYHLCQLINQTRNNPKGNLIYKIRRNRRKGDNIYKKQKRHLSYVTPACLLYRRDLREAFFYENFISFSGYIYLDFDKTHLNDVDLYKEYFVNKYGNIIAFCAISSSYGGLSVLVRVNVAVNHTLEYKQYWNFLANNQFKDEPVDQKSCDLGRAMYISQDSNPFVNYESLIDLSSVQVTRYSIKKRNVHKHIYTHTDIGKDNESIYKEKVEHESNTYIPSYDFADITFKTDIPVKNKILDIEIREYNEIRLFQRIPDTEKHLKHKSFARIIHLYWHLNPDGSVDRAKDIIHYINSKQEFKMEARMLNGLVEFITNEVRKDDYVFQSDFKLIHFSDTSGLTEYQKNRISNEINGLLRKNKSIKRIQEAIKEIEAVGKKVTKAEVVRVSGLSRGTVNSYFGMEEVDISEMERHFNEDEIKYPRFPDFENSDSKRKKKDSPQGKP